MRIGQWHSFVCQMPQAITTDGTNREQPANIHEHILEMITISKRWHYWRPHTTLQDVPDIRRLHKTLQLELSIKLVLMSVERVNGRMVTSLVSHYAWSGYKMHTQTTRRVCPMAFHYCDVVLNIEQCHFQANERQCSFTNRSHCIKYNYKSIVRSSSSHLKRKTFNASFRRWNN